MKDNSKEIGNLSLFKKGMIIATATMTTFAAMSANKAIFAADAEDTETKPVLQYNAHVENIGWQGSKIADILEGNSQIVSTVRVGTTGKSLRMEALTVSLSGIPGASIKYNVHSENKGWTGWKENGAVAGTTGESLRVEAIKICATGLNEAGYSLYYRAHVSNKGWMNWICADDSLNLTNFAGTTGQSLRMEAMEIVLVKNTSTEIGLKEQKAECIANLEKYAIALGTTVIKVETAEAKASQEAYESICKKIKEAEETINKEETDTIEKVLEIYENAITKIEDTYSDINIDKLVEDVEKAANKQKEESLEEIKVYKEELEKANLSDSKKEIIKSIIEKAEKEVNNAKTATTVQKAVEDMEKMLGIYSEYNLNVAKTMAKNTLNEYLDGASKSVKKAINKAIKEIDENIKTKEALNKLVNDTTGLVNAIIPEQTKAEEELKLYEEALESDELEITEASKAIIRNEIAEIRSQIDNAEEVKNVTDAMDNFKNYMNEYYSDVVDEKEMVKIEAQVKEAIAELDEYATCGYENVEEQAIEAKKTITEAEGVAKIKEALEALKGENGTLATLKAAKEAAIKNEEDAQKQFNTKYNELKEELEKYKDIVNNPSTLTAEEVQELNNLIANTEASLKNTTKTSEITELQSIFEKYIETYYSDIETEAEQFKFDRTKENAITTLSAYKDSKNETIANKAKTTIEEIEAITVNEGAKVVEIRAQITAIETKLNNAMEAIELRTAKDNALAQLEQYKGNAVVEETYNQAKSDIENATIDGINTIIEKAIEKIEDEIAKNEDTTKLDNAKTEAVAKLREYLSSKNAEVIATARKAINDIEACTSIEDGKDTKGVTTTLNEAIEEISKLGTEIKTDEEKLEEARTAALKVIKDYTTMAEEIGLSINLEVYENAIKGATTIEEIQGTNGNGGYKAQVEYHITKYYPLLQQKSKAINAIKTTYLPETETEDNNFKYKKYTEYTTAVEKVIKAIKDIEKVEGEEIVTTELEKEITTVIEKITAFDTAQKSAVAAIEIAEDDTNYNATQKRVAATYVADINKVQYVDYTSNKTIFDEIVENAEKAIEAVKTQSQTPEGD